MKRMGVVSMGIVLGMVTACAAQSPSTAEGPTGVTAPATKESPYVPGEVIIKLKGSLSPDERVAVLTSLGLTSVRRMEGINADLVRLPEGESVTQAVERLKQAPSVEYAEPNFIMRIQ